MQEQCIEQWALTCQACLQAPWHDELEGVRGPALQQQSDVYDGEWHEYPI